MRIVSFHEAERLHPDLAVQVLASLREFQPDAMPEAIEWGIAECGEPVDEPLDETAAADIMLTGEVPVRLGVFGTLGGHFSCHCHEGKRAA